MRSAAVPQGLVKIGRELIESAFANDVVESRLDVRSGVNSGKDRDSERRALRGVDSVGVDDRGDGVELGVVHLLVVVDETDKNPTAPLPQEKSFALTHFFSDSPI